MPTLGVADTARYVAKGARAYFTQLLPRDTAPYVGRSYQLRAEVFDRHGNHASDAVTWSAAAGGVTVSQSGVVSATAISRSRIAIRAGSLVDTVFASVVPQATIAAYDIDSREIVTVALDGSSRTVRTTAMNGGPGIDARWLPGSDRLLYSTRNGAKIELRVADASGTSTPFIVVPSLTLLEQGEPVVSARSPWVYFSALDDACAEREHCLHRVRLDGTGAQLLNTDRVAGRWTSPYGLSPDGRFVAFSDGAVLDSFKIMDAESRVVRRGAIQGVYPKWSLRGDSIAFFDFDRDSLVLMSADGSGRRGIQALRGLLFIHPFAWSPDGEWLLLLSYSGQSLVRVSTGEVLPLPHLRSLYEPDWK